MTKSYPAQCPICQSFVPFGTNTPKDGWICKDKPDHSTQFYPVGNSWQTVIYSKPDLKVIKVCYKMETTELNQKLVHIVTLPKIINLPTSITEFHQLWDTYATFS